MGRPKLSEASPSVRLHVLMTEDDIEAIDDWRFASRIGSRGEAVRQLVHMALSQSAAKSEDFNAKLSGWLDAFAP